MATWSYNAGDLDTNTVDALRLEVGDTDSGAWLLANEEYQHAIVVESNYWGAAARCSEYIARLFLRRVDVKLGRAMQVAYAKMAQQYLDMAVKLRQKAMGTVVPYIGGQFLADKQMLQNDPALVAALFTKTMMESPWTGGYSSDSLAPVGNSPTPQQQDVEDE